MTLTLLQKSLRCASNIISSSGDKPAARTHVQCYVYDITVKYIESLTKDAMHVMFRPLCKKYIFQLEKGLESGYVHYQKNM